MSRLRLIDVELIAFFTLLIIKITGAYNLSWFWVFSPAWIATLIGVTLMLAWIAYCPIYWYFKKSPPNKFLWMDISPESFK